MQSGSSSRLKLHPEFVGRSAELGWLERFLQEAIVGRPQLVALLGEPGIGKTRLQSEIRRLARRHKVRICVGRGDENIRLPYRMLADAFSPLLEELALEVPQQVDRARQALGLLNLPVSKPSLDVTGRGEEAHAEVFRALERIVIRALEKRALLLSLDDLHWSDRPSLELLLSLVHSISGRAMTQSLPFMLLCGSRPIDGAQGMAGVFSRLQSEPTCSVIDLGGLAEREVAELVRNLTGERPQMGLVETIHRLTRGNPLFVKELCHHLQTQGTLTQIGKRGSEVELGELELPSTLLSVVASRTRALSDEARGVLALAACIGHRFDLAKLATVSPLEQPALLDHLDEALQQGVLLLKGDVFEFAHPLLRHALYREVGEFGRQRLHLEIAHSLERRHVGHEEAHALEIAAHLVRAGALAAPELLGRYARMAGDKAFAGSAPGDAARFYRACLQAEGERLEPADRADLHCLAGISFYREGDAASSTREFDQAIVSYESAREPAGVARALLERTRVHVTLAPQSYGRQLEVAPLEKALDELEPGEERLRGRILSLLSGVHWTARETERAIERASEALVIAHRLGDASLASEASSALSVAQTQCLDLRAAASSAEDALASARSAADPWFEATALARLPLVRLWMGELDQADGVALQCERASTRIQDWTSRSLALSARVSVAVARGHFSDAESLADDTLRMAERSGYPWGAYNALCALASGRYLQGDLKGAASAIAALVEPGHVFAEPGASIRLIAFLFRSLIQVHDGPSEAQRDQLISLLDAAPAPKTPEIGAIAGFCVAVEIGDVLAEPCVISDADRMLDQARKAGVVISSGWVFLLPRVEGVAAKLRGDWKTATARFREAEELATRMGAAAELARTHLDFARMCCARSDHGDDAEARGLAARARSLFLDLGMQRLADEAAALERNGTLEAGADPRERKRHGAPEFGAPRPAGSPRPTPGSQTGRWLEEFLARVEAAPTITDAPKLEVDGPGVPSDLSGERVILMTDMVGSTQLITELGEAKALEVMHCHNAILRGCLEEHDGTEIQHTGDGIFASFFTATKALHCAIAVQRALAREAEAGADTIIEVRIGIDAGRVRHEEGRLFGLPVNAAARLCATAAGGQILVSGEIPRRSEGSGVSFRDLGRISFAGFSEPFTVHETVW